MLQFKVYALNDRKPLKIPVLVTSLPFWSAFCSLPTSLCWKESPLGIFFLGKIEYEALCQWVDNSSSEAMYMKTTTL